jgi:hypothetical protein
MSPVEMGRSRDCRRISRDTRDQEGGRNCHVGRRGPAQEMRFRRGDDHGLPPSVPAAGPAARETGTLILPFERASPPLFVGETAGLSLPPGVRRSRLGKRPSPDGGFLEHSVTSHATSRVRGVRSGPCIQRSKIAGARVPRSTPRSRSGVSRFWTRCQRSNAAFPAILPARPADISGVDPAAAEQGRPLHRRGPRGEH